jgi:tetratricopeptide (TPR) repeat protein
MIRILVCLFVMVLNPVLNAQEDITYGIDKAITSYDQGRFDDAVAEFEEFIGSSTENYNGSVLYNLGNAHYKSGNSEGALAAYLSARVLAPRDADLKANLSKVVKLIKDDVDVNLNVNRLSQYFPFFEFFNNSEIKLFFSILFLLCCSGSVLIKNIELRRLGYVCAFFAFCVALAGLGVSSLKGKYDIRYGVAKINELAIKSSPGQAGIELFQVSTGTPLLIVAVAGPYYKVEMPALVNGKSLKRGWVFKTDVYSY